MKDHGVKEDSLSEVQNATSAEEIDEIRKRNIAYEYLCHLEEAKMWLEAVLHEKLPPTTELEESLRHGVYLAKLGHFIAPEVVPVSKIYDLQLQRYNVAGLQFRHTDNINYWLKALVISGLPKTFHPETTDVYDKKGMPKVIYCLHALSTHLFKMGRAPLIQALYGKINFTDDEISNMKLALEDNGIPMPAFQKIGGLLSEDLTDDTRALHDVIVKINYALDQTDTEMLLHALENQVAKLHDVKPSYIKHYWNVLRDAKILKVKAAMNRSFLESFTADEYDELLTQAEVQGHITSVNVACSRHELIDAAKKMNKEHFMTILSSPWFGLRNVNVENEPFYVEEILKMEKRLLEQFSTLNICGDLQKVVMQRIEKCLRSSSRSHEDLLKLLKNDVLDMEVEDFASPLYFEELKADLEDTGGLDYHYKVKYWQELAKARQSKLYEKCSCQILTYFDIQNCIDSVNEHYENSNLVIQALHLLNDAVKKRDFKAVENVLKNPVLGLTDNVSSVDSSLFLSMLELRQKQREGSELWLEDVHAVVKDMLHEVHEVQKVCASVSQINMALQQEDPDFTMHALTDAGFNVTGLSINRCYSVLKKYKQKKMANFKGKWIIYNTKRGNKVFLNAGNFNYSWVKPEKFDVECQYLSLRDIEKIICKLHEEQGKRAYINEVFIVRLQSYIRGYLARKLFWEMKREKCALIIQAWWRGVVQRQKFVLALQQRRNTRKSLKFDDILRRYQCENLKAQVTQAIRHNQQLAKQLDTMDIKIGLLVQNRISLQDVIAHSKNLNDLALRSFSSETMGVKGLKSLTKDSRRRLEGYQHLFYMLQTCPNYLAKLLFCLPKDKTSMFIKTVIWSLFNFGTNQREECLLLKLFCSALREEVLDDKTLVINTNPVDIYKIWRNQEEMKRGVVSELPASVSPEQALSHPEVQKRLATSLNALKSLTAFFLDHITGSIHLIPYGLLYIARVLRESLMEKFSSLPDKDILKVVGNLIYYHYINPAIIGPETYGIITLSADNSLSSAQRLNLASIAKILQFAAVKKGFGEESCHLMCLNNFIIECHKKFKTFFRDCCEVEDLDSHFSLHQYSEATLITRPVIYVTLQEICDTHKLLVDYLAHIAPDPMDPLSELLEDMGDPPTIATLVGRSPSDSSLTHLAKTEVCLTLVNKHEVPEDDDTDIHKLFIKAKEILVFLLPCLKGETLVDALSAPETEQQEELYSELIHDRAFKQNKHGHKNLYTTFCINEESLHSCKNLLRQYLAKLELGGLVSQDDHYQTIITAIAHDICNHGKYREIIRQELQTLWETKFSLDQKAKFYEEQVSLYNQYIEKCLENLNAGKRNVHSLKKSSQHRKVKSKLVLKYTAARLHEKGILLEVDGLPASQFKNVQFEISPSDVNGIFTICGRFMGVDLEKVDVDIQHLLQLQFEGESVTDIFGKAKVNVNLLLFLLNKKFYGKN
ncbi:Ras GTPase-activating-like protein IQGAP2 [Gryllus bimaculatus]|nr:Ras GTPase-activating-like protein IQGAP2 [Gryllus bimaculatus]